MRKLTQTTHWPMWAVTALILCLFLATATTGFCTTPKKVAVFPFEMNASEDLTFLQKGLFSMLSSRLSDAGKVDVLDRATTDRALAQAKTDNIIKAGFTEDNARMLGQKIGVDYVLYGSLTHYGESISLDAAMVDVTGKKETLAFFEQSNAMGDVIPLVNSFAGDINMKVFNRNINNKLYARPENQLPTAPGGLQYAGGAGIYGGGMMAMQAGQGFTMHLKVNEVVRAMTTGDLNNDGTTQVIAATDSKLMIHHFDGTILTLEDTLEYKSYLRIVALDVADINGNGYPEIFVSAMTIHMDTLSSFVVEYDGSSYKTLVDGQSCYYRVIKSEDNPPVLYAQKKGRGPFSGDISIMSPLNGDYQEEKAIRMPRYTSVLSLARGTIRGETADEFLSINVNNRLVAINDAGSDEWESTEKYGRTNNYWLLPRNDTDATYRERVYFNPRIMFHPLGEYNKNNDNTNTDNKDKAFVIKNHVLGGGSLGRIKRFKDGYIQVMAWNGIAMAPVFQTAPLQGWISDFDILDLDGDGKDELLVSVVTRSKMAILSKDKASNIISYKLD